jgi:hypothetical protein
MSTNQSNLTNLEPCIPAETKVWNITKFRSEPMRLDTLENWKNSVPNLKAEIAKILFIDETGNNAPIKPDLDDDYALEFFYQDMDRYDDNAVDWLDEHYPEFEIEGHTLVVELCNYKGEVEDQVGLYTVHDQRPVFTCKRDSFADNN